MKIQMILAPTVALICLCIGCDRALESGFEHVTSQPARVGVTTAGTSPWSKEVGGLSGRLLLERENLQPGLRFAVFMELRNTSISFLLCSTQPYLTAELTDSSGRPVPKVSYPMSGPIPRGTNVGLSAGVYAGFRVDAQTMGVPSGNTILLAIGGNPEAKDYGSQAWSLSEGTYTLRVQAHFLVGGNAGFWYGGTIDLPPVEIRVTEKDLRH